MNKVILVGRLTKDPELRATGTGIPVCSFTVACDRRYTKQGEERKADFINCIAWRQTGESIARYFKRGNRIALEGTLQSRSWADNDGKTHYTMEVVGEQWEFAQSKSEAASPNADAEPAQQLGGDLEGFMPVEDEDLPF